MAAKKKARRSSVPAIEKPAIPATATSARRHRPSTKAAEVETPSERRRRAASARRKATTTGRGSKKALLEKSSAGHEDKRESPAEMTTDAKPRNVKADKNDKRSKGKSTHELESARPGKRPSRKSSRRGANHIKPDAQQHRQATREVRSAKNRHAMRGG
jgi:hypothetical protein